MYTLTQLPFLPSHPHFFSPQILINLRRNCFPPFFDKPEVEDRKRKKKWEDDFEFEWSSMSRGFWLSWLCRQALLLLCVLVGITGCLLNADCVAKKSCLTIIFHFLQKSRTQKKIMLVKNMFLSLIFYSWIFFICCIGEWFRCVFYL